MKRRPTKRARIGLTAVALSALAACASDVTVNNTIAAGFLPEELPLIATGNNELRTVIIGNPFGMPQEAFNTAVLASMAGRNFGQRLNLSTNPRQEDRRNRHVVLAFNVATPGGQSALCGGAANTAEAPQTAGRVTVTGVYCTASNRFFTRATARTDDVTGVGSDQFRRLMTQFTVALFPSENPNRRQGGRRRRP